MVGFDIYVYYMTGNHILCSWNYNLTLYLINSSFSILYKGTVILYFIYLNVYTHILYFKFLLQLYYKLASSINNIVLLYVYFFRHYTHICKFIYVYIICVGFRQYSLDSTHIYNIRTYSVSCAGFRQYSLDSTHICKCIYIYI